jgi:hypothetical protein
MNLDTYPKNEKHQKAIRAFMSAISINNTHFIYTTKLK